MENFELSIKLNEHGDTAVTMNGKTSQLLLGLSTIVRGLNANCKIPKALILRAVEFGMGRQFDDCLRESGAEIISIDMSQLKHNKGGSDNGE